DDQGRGPMRSSTCKYPAAAADVLLAQATACGGDTEEGTDRAPSGHASADARIPALALPDAWASGPPARAGTVEVAPAEDGTSGTFAVAGLDPATEYPAHVHAGACDAEPPGGRHWRADPDADGQGSPDHLHTYVVTDAEGAGEMSMESDLVAD